MSFESTLPEAVRIEGKYNPCRTVYVDGVQLDPGVSQKVWNKSEDGFDWGHGSSGPAQLALGVLLNFMPKEKALNYFQRFKYKVIASLPYETDFDVTVNMQQIFKEIQQDYERAQSHHQDSALAPA